MALGRSRWRPTFHLCLSLWLLWITITSVPWYGAVGVALLLGSIYTSQQSHLNSEDTTQHHTEPNPLKGKPRVEVSDLPETLLAEVHREVCDLVTYDATACESLENFAVVQRNSECAFAKRAKLWGSRAWQKEGSIEDNIYRCVPTFLQFCKLCQPLGLDGFLVELPGDLYGQNAETFGEAVRRVLSTFSEHDPAGVHCMRKSYVGKRGWVFEFKKVTMFVTTFAPFYPESSPRYNHESPNCYILLQPEISFAQHDLSEDTPYTNWDKPVTARDKIRVAFHEAGRGYEVRDTVYYPMAWDIVRPAIPTDPTVEWWVDRSKVMAS